MISFMVLGGPRSATTWMANLLTTDSTLCLHDPLLETTSAMLDQMVVPGKPRIGIADTSALLWRDWLHVHPAKKIVLYRDVVEINHSLRQMGLRELNHADHLKRIAALKDSKIYPWNAVFSPSIAAEICAYFEVPFCIYRFHELVKMNVQPQWNRLPVSKHAAQELVRRLAEELK